MKELETEAADARATKLRENATALRKKVEAIGVAPKARKEAAALAKRSEKLADEMSSRKDNDDDDAGGSAVGTQLPLHRVRATHDGKPKNKAQRNMTDGDSRIMVRNGVFMQAYNAQAVVSEDQIIVAHGVTNTGADAEQLAPMLERTRQNCGRAPEILSADNGYMSDANVAYCEKVGTSPYISLTKREATRGEFPPRTASALLRFIMQVKLGSNAGKAIYAKRKVIVEPVFGQIKAAMGFRRFSLRGLLKVPHEWAIVSTCHNLLKLFRSNTAQLARA
jgi:hypothetical protein